MRYQVWFNTVLIIEDFDWVIDIKQVSKEFNEALLKAGEISYIESKFLRRIGRIRSVVFANVLSSLDIIKMLEILKKYGLEPATEDLIGRHPYLKLPKRSLVSGECHSGAFRHTFSIDEGVKPLVAAINKIKGVRTFASCDGHGQRCLYVSFRVRKHVPQVLKLLDEAFNEVYPKYNFTVGPFKVSYNVGYTDFIFRAGLYYFIKVDYYKIDKERLFSYIADVGEAITRRVRA